ncbi:hypothetical protein [Streptomyces malaysiensis]
MARRDRARRGLPGLPAPGTGCDTGERLLHAYEEAARQARPEEGHTAVI